jgi:hypothetical protein
MELIVNRIGRISSRSDGTKKVRARPALKRKWKQARKKGAACLRSRLDPEIQLMHADYLTGMSLAAVGRKYRRHRASVRELFIRRALSIRPPAMIIPPQYPNGQIIPMRPATSAELRVMLASAKKLAVPAQLKLEWRKWSLARRGEFIARLRKKLNSPKERPTTPFSDNVEAFDYASTRAQEIAAHMNQGRNARTAAIKLDICSQGVIYRGKLWFWCRSKKIGYQMGPWKPGEGRPCLHRVIWEEANGRKLLRDEVVRFIDGNWNNLMPKNLRVATMNDLARENQAKALTRKSRALTELLLKKTQEKGKSHANREIVTAIQQAKNSAR